MGLEEVIFALVELGVFIYMLGIGYQLLPDPGKSGSVANKEHFDKYRHVFKFSGIAGILYVLLSFTSSML